MTRPLVVDCDVERVGRVIENLITNAVKYSPDGGPIDVSVTEECGFAVVRVADCGIGIPRTQRERLFELGYRADNAASVAPGPGLGLYIASEIVGRHGGSLDATDRDSGGSVFTDSPAARRIRPRQLRTTALHRSTVSMCIVMIVTGATVSRRNVGARRGPARDAQRADW